MCVSLSVDILLQDLPLIPDLDVSDVVVLTPELANSSPQWLYHRLEATHNALVECQVPPAASVITTPLVPSAWRTMLISYPHRHMVDLFLHGITTGFRVGYNLPSTTFKSAKKNMKPAYDHMEVITDYLATEVAEGRAMGPLSPSMVPSTHINRCGVIPMSHQPNRWRLIVDHSHPHGKSVNDGI